MRTLTTPESQLLAGDHVQVRARVQVKDANGDFKNLSAIPDSGSTARDWLQELQWEDDIDTAVAQATVTLVREASGQSLAPMLTTSTLNRKAGNVYAPLIDAGREVKIEVATVSVATATPAAGDWKLLFHGDIDEVDWGKGDSRVQIAIRDLGGRLQDNFIEAKRTYVPSGSAAVETVMQQILNDNNTGVTLYTPVSPGWMIGRFEQDQVPVLDALRKLAEQIGWDVRYRWNASQSRFDLTFYQPPRGKVAADWTIGPRQYLDVSNLAVNRAGVRNVVKVNFRNSATNLDDHAIADDVPSITRYGRRFMELVEAEAPLIDTTAEAQTLAGRILSDLKDPLAEQEVEMHFFWPVELGDLYSFQPNGVHYDTAQSWAVVGYRHQLGAGQWRTTLTTRGTVAGAYRDWLRREIRVSGPDDDAEVTWKTEVTENAAGTVGTLKLTVADPSSRVQQVQFYVTEGGAARAAYTITPGAGGVYQRDVALHPKHLAVVEPVITLKDGRILQPGSETFDTGSLPDVLAVLPEVGDTGVVAVTARGDSDTRSFRVLGRTDRFPTLAEVQAAAAFPPGGVAARETVAAAVLTLGVGQTAYVGVVAYSGVSGAGNASALATEQVTRIERVPPTVSVRVANNTNRDAADLFVTVESVIAEQARLHFKDIEGSATVWSLVASSSDTSARWVNSGTVLGPTDWFHSGAAPAQKLGSIALTRDQVKRVLVQAESRSGAKSTWVPVTLDVKEQPWLESVTMTFNDAADQLEMTAVGGAFTRSAKFEFSATEAFTTVLSSQAAALVDGGRVTVTWPVGALRDQTLYGRVIPYNGVLVDSNADGIGDAPSGISGPPQLVNAYVAQSDPPRVYLQQASTGRTNAVTVTLTAYVGAGGRGPLQYRRRVVSYEGTITTDWTAWTAYTTPVNLNVTRLGYYEQVLQVEVRDADLRTAADDFPVHGTMPGTGDDGRINRGHPFSGTTDEYPFSTMDRLSTGLEPQADIAGINAHVVSRSQHGFFLETFEQAPADWTTLWNFRAGSGSMLSVQPVGVAGGKALRITGNAWITFKRNLPYDPGKLYRLRVRARQVSDPTAGGKLFYAGLEAVGADGATLVNNAGANLSTNQFFLAANGVSMAVADGWTEFTGWFRGTAAAPTGAAAPNPSAPGQLHTQARYLRPLLRANHSGGNGVVEVDEVAIDVQDEDAFQRTYTTLRSGGGGLVTT
ncbi:MAG TPA: hypothetical protein VFQ39_02750, partial [Longimicrobium sp.]|nr:hypothetical protein [Longimicrobium sp.]